MRLMMVIFPAAIVTFSLQLVMVTLIEFSDDSLDTSPTIKLPDIYMPEMQIETQRSVEKPDKPELDDTPPPDVPQQAFDDIDGSAEVGALAAPDRLNASLDLNMGSGLSATDGEYLPIVKVAPNYPRRALSRGMEGEVLLEYTVTKQGTVKDPKVLQSTNGVFDDAAIESALRYKYKPRVVDGQAIEVDGVRTWVRFRLQQGS